MKSTDPLVARWGEILAQKAGAPAIFDTRGGTARTFGQIEKQARDFEVKLHPFSAGAVVAIQIGNHPDWPSTLLACLRRGLVVLPLETTISQGERDAALEICQASSVVAPKAFGAGPVEIIRPRRAA